MTHPTNNPLFNGAKAAMQRAALRARQIAQQTGTAIIVVRNGETVRLSGSDINDPAHQPRTKD